MRLISWLCAAVLAAGFGISAHAQPMGPVTASPAAASSCSGHFCQKVHHPLEIAGQVERGRPHRCGQGRNSLA